MDIATLGLRVDRGEVIAARKSLDDLEGAGARAEARAGRMKVAFAAAGVAIAGLVARETLRNTIESQSAYAQLEAVVRSTGGAAGFTVGQLEAMANALEKTTAFSGEAVMGAQSLLLTFTQIKGANFDAATKAVADLAQAMGGDMKGAAIQVGKALNDPVAGITALRKVGVSFTDSQREVIKSLAETGDVAGAQRLILAELAVEFGGSAKAARETLGGALAGLRNSFGNLFAVTKGGSQGLIDLINRIATALDNSGVTMASFVTQTLVGWERMKATVMKVHQIMSLPIGPGFLEAARQISQRIDVDLSAAIARITATAKATTGLGTAAVGTARATTELTEAQKKANEEIARQRVQNEDTIRQAEQALDLAGLEGETLERTRISYDALNKTLEAHRTLKGEILEETLKAIDAEEKFKQAAVGRAAAAQADRQAMDAAKASLAGFSEDVSSKLAKSLTRALGEDNPLRGLFESLTKQLLAIWMRNFIQPAAAAMMGISSGESMGGSGGIADASRALGPSRRAAGAGVAVAGFGVGYAIGANGNGSAAQGALGGALGGAASGAALGAAGGPLGAGIGALIGGFAGLAGGILGAGKAAKEAEKNMRGLRESLAVSIAGIKSTLAGDELGVAVAQTKAQFDALRKQTEDAYKTGKNEAARKVVLAELNALEAQSVALLKEKTALALRQVTEDVELQIMRNNGATAAADALAKQIDQERRLAELRKAGVSEALLGELKASEATRDAAIAAQAAADAEAVAAAKAIEAAAAAAQAAAEAAKKAFDQARAVQDLDVELLRAKGRDAEADAAAFALAQKRRLEDAKATQSEEYVRKLEELQQLQRDSRAADALIASTGGASGSPGAAQAAAASRASAAVQSTTTERTALALVDLTRAEVTILGEIRELIRKTGAGGSGGGVTINNRFDFSAKLTDEELRDVVEKITDGIDEALGAKSSRAGLYSGSVGR